MAPSEKRLYGFSHFLNMQSVDHLNVITLFNDAFRAGRFELRLVDDGDIFHGDAQTGVTVINHFNIGATAQPGNNGFA